MKILVINCGSSSLKYQLIDMDNSKALASGKCDRIGVKGIESPFVEYKGKDGKPLKEDGDLGDNTEYAITCFQKDKKLQINTYGTVGAKTWTALLNCA